MKKDTFVKGAVISVICIVASKIMGILYVIPFQRTIGSLGGALYSYGYSIYTLFLQLSTVGIPLAISKIVSEYNTLNYHNAARRTYKIAIIITSIIALLATIILLVFAPGLAYLIKGDLIGGNSLEDIALIIRVSASALFLVTMLSNIRGYLQGQKYITSSSYSQVIEQLVRIIVIIFGSKIAVELFGVTEAVAVAMFGATLGAIAALIYLIIKNKKYISINDDYNYKIKAEEKKITNKFLTIKLIKCTIPFVILSIIMSLYSTIDMFTVIKGLVNYSGVVTEDAEYIVSCISTWGAKLNMILTSITSGIVVSLLPNITSDYTKKDYESIREKVVKTINIILILLIPMATGLSFLAQPIWTIFYGYNELGINVFKFSIFTAIFNGIFTNMNVIVQSVNKYKTAYISIFSGIIFKAIFNVPFIIIFPKINIPVYYASICATIGGYLISIIISLIGINKEFKLDIKGMIKTLFKTIFATLVMFLGLNLLKIVLPFNELSLIKSFIYMIIYSLSGIIIYFLIMYTDNDFKMIIKKVLHKLKISR